MSQLEDFVADARAKNVDDEKIKNSLKKQGWQDDEIDMALLGLSAPKPQRDSKDTPTSVAAGEQRPSISPLTAALNHVLLWFFTAASTITIAAVSSSLFGGDVSTEALAAMIAVVAVTFTPYAFLYIKYLLQVRRNPELIPGRVWSIITICIHSVGAMIAAITLVVSLIVSPTPSVITGAALIVTLNIIVIVNYVLAAFSHPSLKRKVGLKLHLIALGILLGGLFVISIARLAPAQADVKTQESLVDAVNSVREYTASNQKLPENKAALTLPEGTDYRKLSPTTYEVCADFNLNTNQSSSNYNYGLKDNDTYVSEYNFRQHKNGNECYEFESTSLKQRNQSRDIDLFYENL